MIVVFVNLIYGYLNSYRHMKIDLKIVLNLLVVTVNAIIQVNLCVTIDLFLNIEIVATISHLPSVFPVTYGRMINLDVFPIVTRIQVFLNYI